MKEHHACNPVNIVVAPFRLLHQKLFTSARQVGYCQRDDVSHDQKGQQFDVFRLPDSRIHTFGIEHQEGIELTENRYDNRKE